MRQLYWILVGVAACGGKVTGVSGGAPGVPSPASADSAATLCPSATEGEQALLDKGFLIDTQGSTGDPGWTAHASIVAATPDVGSLQGTEQTVTARFSIDSIGLQLLIPAHTTDQVLDSWTANSVDMSGGCQATTGGVSWQVRDGILWDFDKHDMSDLEIFGQGVTDKLRCVTPSTYATSLVPGSLVADDSAGTLQWTVSITGAMSCPGFSETSLALQVAYSLTRQ